MTLAMPDSTRVSDLPPGYPAYLGYCDGRYVTEPGLDQRFPAAHKVILTVTGSTPDADGCDIETGDLTSDDGALWARAKISAQPGSRPVLYASVSRMESVLTGLTAVGISRGQVRLLTAHWGQGEHICGPRSCGQLSTDADGTQWTDEFRTNDGQGPIVDMSALRDDFFGSWTEELVRQLATVQQGSQGEAVRTAQGALVARHHLITVDGLFGPATDAAVRQAQSAAHITADGIVGPQTWPVLLGIA